MSHFLTVAIVFCSTVFPLIGSKDSVARIGLAEYPRQQKNVALRTRILKNGALPSPRLENEPNAKNVDSLAPIQVIESDVSFPSSDWWINDLRYSHDGKFLFVVGGTGNRLRGKGLYLKISVEPPARARQGLFFECRHAVEWAMKQPSPIIQLVPQPKSNVLCANSNVTLLMSNSLLTKTQSLPSKQGKCAGWVTFSPDGNWLAAAAWYNVPKTQGVLGTEILLWKASSTGKFESKPAIHRFKSDRFFGVSRIEFSPDGKLLAGVHVGEVIVWDFPSLKIVNRIKVGPQVGRKQLHFRALGFSRKGQFLLLQTNDGRIYHVDRKTGKSRVVDDTKKALSYSPHLRFHKKQDLAVSSSYKAIQFWNVISGSLIHSIEFKSKIVRAIDIDSTGARLVSYMEQRDGYPIEIRDISPILKKLAKKK